MLIVPKSDPSAPAVREALPEPLPFEAVTARLDAFDHVAWLLAADAARIAEQLDRDGWPLEGVLGVLAAYKVFWCERVADAVELGFVLRRVAA